MTHSPATPAADPLEPVATRMLRLATELDTAHAALQVAHGVEQRTRLSLLRIHAWMSVIAGLAMTFTGTAPVLEDTFGTPVRPILGLTAAVAGLMLIYGINSRHGRLHTVEAVGLVLVGAWDVAMGASFILSLIAYGHVEVRGPWDLRVIDAAQPRPYAPAIYFGLAAMVSLVHLRAVLRDRRADRSTRSAPPRA